MQRKIMSTKEVARYLGVHEKNIYRLARDRRIPGTKLGGKWVFPKHLIDEWIDSNARANFDPEAKKQKKNKLLLCGRQS